MGIVRDELIALKASLTAQLAAVRGVDAAALPPALLDIEVRRAGEVLFVLPADWEQLRHEEGGDGRGVPYWARAWPAGVALAGALEDDPPRAGTKVLELGCGLALPSVVAARAGAHVLATDGHADAVVFAAHVLALNEVEGEVGVADWTRDGDALAAQGPWDLVLGADLFYTRANVDAAFALFGRLVAPGGALRIADPNRQGAEWFLDAMRATFDVRSERGEDVSLHTLRPRTRG